MNKELTERLVDLRISIDQLLDPAFRHPNDREDGIANILFLISRIIILTSEENK